MDDAWAIDRRQESASAQFPRVETVDATTSSADFAFRQTAAYAQVELFQLVDQSIFPTEYFKLC